MSSLDWICCQIGAREHYAVPRALVEVHRKISMITDVWVPPSQAMLFPSRWKQRFHPGLEGVSVAAWNLNAAFMEAGLRFRGLRGWDRTLARNRWFEHKAAKTTMEMVASLKQQPIVFAFSYAAAEIFTRAKASGCRTILGQIDPGPVEMEIVRRLEAELGGPQTEWPPDSYWDQWREECELADCIVVNSDWSRQALVQEGIPESKLRIVPLAYESRASDALSGDKDLPERFDAARPLQVLFLGQLISRKGIRELTQAIRRMEGAPVEWNLVGGADSATLAELRKLPQTHVPGAVSRKEAAHFYSSADVFILPTHSDGFAITQLEAMSFGLPVVASACCGQVAEHDRTGLILPAVSADAIEATVSRLIDEPGLLRRLAGQVRLTPVRNVTDLANDLLEIERQLMRGAVQGV